MKVSIPFGASGLSFHVPDPLMGKVLRPRPAPALPDVRGALAEAWENEHCRLFFQRVRRRCRQGGDVRAAIAVNDYTRPTPLGRVLPALLDALNRQGLPDSSIRIIAALGTHRPMSREEFLRQAGEEVLRRTGFLNPRLDSPAQLRSFGRSASGVEVWISREYAQADFKIAVGTILPHGAVGFSGGAKLIYPGIAGRRTVEAFHRRANSNPANRTGFLDSPIRREIEELVGLVGLDLMINLVVNPAAEICGLACGHYISSHREAVPLAREIYGVPIGRRSTVLVAGSHPADLDFWQAAKCIFNCQSAVQDGGWLIVVTPCPEGIPAEHAAFDRYIGLPSNRIEALLLQGAGSEAGGAAGGESVGRAAPAPGAAELGSGHVGEPDRVTLAPALPLARFRERIRIGVVSPGLEPEQVERMGFTPFASVEKALEHLREEGGGQGMKVDVISHGGETYPLLEEDSTG